MTSENSERRLAELEDRVSELRIAEDFRDFRETSKAIEEGLASIERGEGIPAEEAFAMLRREFGIQPAAAIASDEVGG